MHVLMRIATVRMHRKVLPNRYTQRGNEAKYYKQHEQIWKEPTHKNELNVKYKQNVPLLPHTHMINHRKVFAMLVEHLDSIDIRRCLSSTLVCVYPAFPILSLFAFPCMLTRHCWPFFQNQRRDRNGFVSWALNGLEHQVDIRFCTEQQQLRSATHKNATELLLSRCDHLVALQRSSDTTAIDKLLIPHE